MLQEKITIQNKLGLHTRAAAKLVALASQYESKIELKHDAHIANCKSIMAIIMLGLTKGTTIDLKISGADELDAGEAIKQLVNGRFGESE